MQKKLVEVCYTPGGYDYYKGNFEIVVVIDVLRATSAICSAIHNGVKSLIPVSTIEEAKAYQDKGYLVGAERQGQIVSGFDFGNSPYSYMKPEIKGKDIVLSTTNGTRAINIAKDAETVVIGALSNLDYLINWLKDQDKNVLCLCSGWKDKFNLEDSICGGAIAEGLLKTGKFISNEDASVAAKYLYLAAKDNYFGFLKSSSHRRRLKKLNLNEDIKFCLTPNQMEVIPILKGDRLVKLDT
ncbi:2-phosphosulfolactate phosphatase [Brumimicrobium salinarum]|uniref:Probable 2-phosphosulfolactate phosphatase n=1 Tax=Brumimicrobium salinarum TaxID=2058658 RepID=A0A2I0R4Z1_9FLAO|nr:2-phosphosulfolactate phosphatase [Brumimicrobium salinarum]PKR81609.1 2-phosphosulfolactate phosphatase [Brumimicrobium salinarum]